MCKVVFPACMSVQYIHALLMGPEEASGQLEGQLELKSQRVVSLQAGAKN